MKLSIITVNLNNRGGLQKTIDSVVSQTFKDFEWIVIDGGSTDGSRELIEDYADHFAYWCSEQDKGIYNAMNKGIAHAIGEYCLFLNSGDCLTDSNVLINVGIYLQEDDIIYGDARISYTDGRFENRCYPDIISLGYLFEGGKLCHQATFIKTALFSSKQYDDNYKIAADFLFFLEQAFSGKKFKHVHIFVCDYSMGGISDVADGIGDGIGVSEIISAKESIPTSPILIEVLERCKAQKYLANTKLEVFSSLCSRHHFLRRCITFIILSMKILDNECQKDN